MQNAKCKMQNELQDVPSPLRGEGRRERSERGVRGRTGDTANALTPHPRPLSPEGRGNGHSTFTFAFCILNFAFIATASAGEPPTKPVAPTVNESDLQRIARVPVKILPWRVNPVPVAPPP